MPQKGDPDAWGISANTGSEKYVEINVSKAVFHRTLRQTPHQTDRNTLAIWMTAPFQYVLITLKVVTLEKVSFSDTINPKAVC